MIPMVEMDKHYNECESYPIKCEDCEFEVRKSEFEKHSCVKLLSGKVKTQQVRIDQLEKEVLSM